jgi:hypothetical protein
LIVVHSFKGYRPKSLGAQESNAPGRAVGLKPYRPTSAPIGVVDRQDMPDFMRDDLPSKLDASAMPFGWRQKRK